MKKIVFLLGLVLGGLVTRGFPQTLADTFQNFIPSSIRNTDTTKCEIAAQLSHLGEIHPDLLYHYFKFLNVVVAQPGTARAQSEYRRFNALKHNYELRRQQWAKKQIESLYRQTNSSEMIELVKTHFEKLSGEFKPPAGEENPDFSAPSDSLNYLVVQYYQRPRRLDYVPGKVYLRQRQTIEAKFRASFSKTLATLSEIPRLSHHELTGKFLRYWHLYENPATANTDSVFAGKFLLAVEQHYYSLRDIPNDLVKPPRLAMAGGFYQNRAYRFTHTIPIIELKNLKLRLDKPTNFSQTVFSFQSRLSLRDYLTGFSYLNIQFASLRSRKRQRFSFNNSLGYTSIVKDATTKITTYYEEIAKFTKGEATVNLRKSYWSRLSFPIIIANKHLFIEAGVLFGKNSVSYQTQYNYRYSLIETKVLPNLQVASSIKLKDGESGARTQNQTLTQWFVSPSLSGVIQLPYRLTLEISLFEKYTTLTAGFALW